MEGILKSQLAEAVTRRTPFQYNREADQFTFGMTTFSGKANVPIPAIESEMASAGGPYTLYEIYYFLLNFKLPVDQYMARAKEVKVRYVQFLHREKVFAHLFPTIAATEFNPSWIFADGIIGDEPAKKKPRTSDIVPASEEDWEKWRDYVRSFGSQSAGASMIQKHWNRDCPKLAPELQRVVKSDPELIPFLQKIQRPSVTREEAACVPPDPKANTSIFFKDVQALVEVVMKKHEKEIAAMKAAGTPGAGGTGTTPNTRSPFDTTPAGAVAAATKKSFHERIRTSIPSVSPGPSPVSPADATSSIAALHPSRRQLERVDPRKTPLHVPVTASPASGIGLLRPRKPFHPIIVVPSAPSVLLTIYNVREFLQDGLYVPPQQKKIEMVRTQGPINYEDNIVISSEKLVRPDELERLEVRQTHFRVTDHPERLKPHEWDRVVAVFVIGALWQFSNWEISKNPVEIFAKVRGFHLTYQEDRPHEIVSKWMVKRLQISKTDSKRYIDLQVAKEFWHELYRFMRTTPRFSDL